MVGIGARVEVITSTFLGRWIAPLEQGALLPKSRFSDTFGATAISAPKVKERRGIDVHTT